jgi:Gpi18-like mannosyltransferase
MYVLYLAGALRELFGLSFDSLGHNILVKMPAMLADLGIGMVLFSMGFYAAETRKHGIKAGMIAASLFVFNPLVIMLSATWGQVDSVFSLFLLLSLYLLVKGRDTKAYLLYALAILIKPQALMFGPVYLVLGIRRILDGDNRLSLLMSFLLRGFAAFALIILAMLPFGLGPVLEQMTTRLVDAYPFVSLNAYNIYVLFGLNWHDVNDTFLGLSFAAWGVIAMGLAAVIGGLLAALRREGFSAFYSSAAICVFVYTFAARMHERYSFPIFMLLLAAYALRPDRKILVAWAALLLPAFLNNLDVLRGSLRDMFHFFTMESRITALGWMLAFACFAAVTALIYRKKVDF